MVQTLLQGTFFNPSPTANLVGVEEGRPVIWCVLFWWHAARGASLSRTE